MGETEAGIDTFTVHKPSIETEYPRQETLTTIYDRSAELSRVGFFSPQMQLRSATLINDTGQLLDILIPSEQLETEQPREDIVTIELHETVHADGSIIYRMRKTPDGKKTLGRYSTIPTSEKQAYLDEIMKDHLAPLKDVVERDKVMRDEKVRENKMAVETGKAAVDEQGAQELLVLLDDPTWKKWTDEGQPYTPTIDPKYTW